MQKFATIKAQPLDLPNALALEITSHCNLKCKGCPLTTRRSLSSAIPGNISDALWKKIIPIARQVRQVTIGGFGEPLTNPQCITLLQQLNNQYIYMGISTNGHLLSKSISRKLAALKYLTHINISIDSPDPEEYQRFRGARLENALNGVKNLMHHIDNPVKVTVSSIVMSRNISNLADLPTVLRKFGVKKYILQGLIEFNPEFVNEYRQYQNKLSSNLIKITKACQKANIQLQLTTPDRFNKEIQDLTIAENIYYSPKNLKPNETRKCCLPWETPFINKNGDVFPCCYAASSGNSVMGNLHNKDW